MATRKILFRGQVRRKGDRTSISGEPLPGVWVLGGVFPQNKGYDYAIIYQQEPKVEKYVVYAETVGQYTGIIDSIGAKVFEDDIITFWIRRDEAKIRLKGIVKYTESLACFTVSTSEPSGTDSFVQLKDCCGIHVIGNTFDGEFDKDEEELKFIYNECLNIAHTIEGLVLFCDADNPALKCDSLESKATELMDSSSRAQIVTALEEFRDLWKCYDKDAAEKAQALLDCIASLFNKDGESQ